MSVSDWNNQWELLRKIYQERSLEMPPWQIGWKEGEPPRLLVEPAATDDEILGVEHEMGCSIPASFRKILREYSRHVDIRWAFPQLNKEHDNTCDGKFRSISCGILHWSLHELPKLQSDLRKFRESVFSDPTDKYGSHWYEKFAFYDTGDSDFYTIDLADDKLGRIVFLSHDGEMTNGFPLAENFETYVDSMSLLGCPAVFEPFINYPNPYLQVDGENARSWRKWFGFDE